MSSYAERFRQLREAAGWTIKDLAKEMSASDSPTSIWQMEGALLDAEDHAISGQSLSAFGLVLLTEKLDCTDAEAAELVARRMAEGCGLGDEWGAFTRVAGLVIERYSDDREEAR